MHNDSENLEALLNIFANATEIFGTSTAIALLVGAISILFLKKWGVAGKLGGAGVVAFIIGFATPGFLNWVVASIRDANIPMRSAEPWLWVLGVGSCILAVIACGVAYCLPSIVAFKRQKQNRSLICILNILLGLLPFGWNGALFMSFLDDTEKCVSSTI